MTTERSGWYGVRCVFEHGPAGPQGTSYEERVTLWRAGSFDDAIELAEEEARQYAGDLTDVSYLDLAQCYELGESPGHAAEVFSLIRESPMAANDYLDSFFDTGRERQSLVE